MVHCVRQYINKQQMGTAGVFKRGGNYTQRSELPTNAEGVAANQLTCAWQ